MRTRCGLHAFIKYVPSLVGSVHSRDHGRDRARLLAGIMHSIVWGLTSSAAFAW